MHTPRVKQFITNPRPRWWASAATWIGLALIGLVLIYIRGGYVKGVQGSSVLSRLTPNGYMPVDADADPAMLRNLVPVSLVYEYSYVLGVYQGQVSFPDQNVSAEFMRELALLWQDPPVQFHSLRGSENTHRSLVQLSLLGNGALVTNWHRWAYILVPLKWILLASFPLFVSIVYLRMRESRRCHRAAHAWRGGLCPACQYQRDPKLSGICPECGSDMLEYATLAAARLDRDLDDPEAWANARERTRSEREILNDNTPLF